MVRFCYQSKGHKKITPPLSTENEGDIYYIVFINAFG